MILAIGIGIGLLVHCCPNAGYLGLLAANSTTPVDFGEDVAIDINAASNHPAPTPFGREDMTATLLDEEEERDLDSFSSVRSCGLGKPIARSRHQSRNHSPLHLHGLTQHFESSVELRC